jgi:hypothetical protein
MTHIKNHMVMTSMAHRLLVKTKRPKSESRRTLVDKAITK